MTEDFKGSRILLVEDEETLAVGLEYNLTEEGYIINWARNGKEAIELFKKEKFDLIILDIMLPYLNGFEVAEINRKADPQTGQCRGRLAHERRRHGLLDF